MEKTLRDEFAMAALMGWMASFGPEDKHPTVTGYEDITAKQAYKLADAMMSARQPDVTKGVK